MSIELEQTKSELRNKYNEIAEAAQSVICEGIVEQNPILLGKKDPRYALYICGFISGLGDSILEKVTQQIHTLETSMRRMPNGYRHATIRELQFNEGGRRKAGVSAEIAAKYYKTLQAEFAIPGQPITLELDRIMLAKDREQSSLSLVAALLPKNDLTLIEVRQRVTSATERAQLPLGARLNGLSVILCTLGRFPYPIRKENNTFPIVEEIKKINSSLPIEKDASIRALVVGSTTERSYVWADEHVFFAPPLLLDSTNEQVKPLIVRARW